MLQVRFNLITADPLRLGDMAKFVEAEVRPGVESLHGSLGMLLAAKKQAGVARYSRRSGRRGRRCC